MDQQTIFALSCTIAVIVISSFLIGQAGKRSYRKGRKAGFAQAQQLTTIQLAMVIHRGPDLTLLMDAPHYTRGYWNAITEEFLTREDRPQ